MVIGLSHRIAHPVTLHIFVVGLDDMGVYIGVLVLKPGGQSRAEIKIDVIKVASFGVRTIAFRGDLFVKIGKWSRGGFDGNLSCKWVISRRLIKMPMQTQVCRAGPRPLFVCFA